MKSLFKQSRVLLAAILLLGILAGCSKKSNENVLQESQNLLENNEYEAALIQAKNLLKQDGRNLDARLVLAQSYYGLQQYTAAKLEFEKLLDADSMRVAEFASTLLEIYYILEETIAIIDLWEKEFESNSNAELPPVGNLYVALAYYQNGDNNKAKRVLDDLLARQGLSEEIEFTAGLLRDIFPPSDRTKIIYGADKLSGGVAKFNESIILWSLYSKFHAHLKSFEEAAEGYRTLTRLLPKYDTARIILADTLVRGQEIEEANTLINDLLKKYPNQAYLHYLSSVVALHNNDLEHARRMVEAGKAKGLDTVGLRVVSGYIYYQLELYELAMQNLAGVVSKLAADHPANKILIATQLKLGHNEEAFAGLDVDGEIKIKDENFLAIAGFEMLRDGDREQAARIAEKIDSSQIDNVHKLQQIGLLKFETGDESGIQDFEKALEISNSDESLSSTNAKGVLVAAYIVQGDFSGAESKINEWIAESPQDAENYVFLANIKQKQGNIEEAESLLAKSLEMDQQLISPRMYFGIKDLKSANFESAVTLFQSVVELNPNHTGAILGHYYAKKSLGKAQEAIDLARSVIAKPTANEKTKQVLAHILLLEKKSNDVLKLLLNNAGDYGISEAVMIGDAYTLQEKYEDAIEFFDMAISAVPNSKRVLMRKIYALEKLDRFGEVLTVLEAYYREHPDSKDVAIMIAYYYEIGGRHSEARRIVDSLPENYQSSIFGQGVRGKLLFSEGQYEQALPLLDYAHSKVPDAKLAQMLYYAKSKVSDSKAFDVLENFIKIRPQNIQIRLVYANELLSVDKTQASSQYRELLNYDASNIIALNNLAILLMEQENFTEAKQMVQRALEVQPNNPRLLDTLKMVDKAYQQ